MSCARLLDGPLDGHGLELADPPPDRIALGVPARLGGPGTAAYDRDPEGVFLLYRYAGDGGPDGRGLTPTA